MSHLVGLLESSGAILNGHFVLNSWRHSGRYVNKAAGLVLASHAQVFGRTIAEHFGLWGITCVVAPELGAVPLGTRVADALSHMHGSEGVSCVIATKVKGADPVKFEIGRDQARFVEGRK